MGFVVTRPRLPAATHTCPCGCGAAIARHLLSCRQGWFRLPKELRDRINAAWRRDRAAHAAAIRDALDFYRDNPPRTER